MTDGDRSDDEASDADPLGEEGSEDDPFGDEVFDDGPSGAAGDPFDDPDANAADDPFAALGEGIDDAGEGIDDADGAVGDAGEATPRSDPEPAAPADDPFAELDADRSGEPTDGDPFESMGSGDVGEEDVWEALDEGTSVGADAAGSAAVGDAEAPGSEFAGTAPGAGTLGDERVVDKRSYCQQCPHFTAPPETSCTHEGTEIVESVDFSRFRVRDCPMVDAEDPAFDEE